MHLKPLSLSLLALPLTTLAAPANKSPLEARQNGVCNQGSYASFYPYLNGYDVAVAWCSAHYPVQCTQAPRKRDPANRFGPVTTTTTTTPSQAAVTTPATTSQVVGGAMGGSPTTTTSASPLALQQNFAFQRSSAWSRGQQQGGMWLSTMCSCIEQAPACTGTTTTSTSMAMTTTSAVTTTSSMTTSSASSAGSCVPGTVTLGNGQQYTVTCNFNYFGGNTRKRASNILAQVQGVRSLSDCINSCSNYGGCTAVDFYRTSQGSASNQVAGNCFLLSNTKLGGGLASGIDAATLVNPPTSSTTSAATSSSSSSSTMTTTSSSSSSMTTSSSSSSSMTTSSSTSSSMTTSSSSSSSSMTTTSMTSTVSTSTSSSSTSSSSAACTPGSFTDTASGKAFNRMCNFNYNGGNVNKKRASNILQMQMNVPTLEDCINSCAGYPGCVALDWYEKSIGTGANQLAGNCFLLSSTALGGGYYYGIDAATLVAATTSSTSTSSSSTSTSTSTSMSTSTSSSMSTSSSSSSTSSSMTSTSMSTSSSSTTSTSMSTSSTTSTSMSTSTSSSSSSSTSTGSTSTSSTSTASTSTSSTSTSSTSMSTTSMTSTSTSSTSTTSSSTTTSATPACTNGATTATDGTAYTVQCNYNYGGDNNNILADFQNVASLGACIDFCELSTACVALDYYTISIGSASSQASGNCYLLSNAGGSNGPYTGVNAAIRGPRTTSSSSTSTVSSTTSSSSSSTTSTTMTTTASTSTTTGSTTTSSSSTTTSSAPATITATDGSVYTVQYNFNYNGGSTRKRGVNRRASNIITDLQGVPDLTTCINYCETYAKSGCVAVDFYRKSQGTAANQVAGNCYLLSNTDFGGAAADGVDAAIVSNRVTTTTSSSSTSSSTSMSTTSTSSSSTTSASTTSTSTMSTSTTSTSTVSTSTTSASTTSTSTTSASTTSTSSSSTSTTSASTTSTSTMSTSTTSASTSSTSTTSASTTSSSSSTTASTTTSSSTTASTTTSSSTTTTSSTTSAACTAGPTMAANGAKYLVTPDLDYAGGGNILGSFDYISTFADCLNLCGDTQNCVAVDYYLTDHPPYGNAQRCYLLSSTSAGSSASTGECAASLLPVIVSTSTSSTTTSTTTTTASTTTSSSTTASTTTSSSTTASTTTSSSTTASTTTSSSTTASTTTSSSTTTTTASTTTMMTTTTSSSTTTSASTTTTSGKCLATPVFDSSSCGAVPETGGSVNGNYGQVYSGSGFITNPRTDSGNSKTNPYGTYYFDTYQSACQAIQQCAAKAYQETGTYYSFDVHYLSGSCRWECFTYYGYQQQSDFSKATDKALAAFGYNFEPSRK